MKRSLACSLTILALACGVAHADGSGTLYQDGKPLALVSAYAYRGPDPFEKTKEITTIVFSDICDSTATLERIGDAEWTRVVRGHNERIRTVIDRFRGPFEPEKYEDTYREALLDVIDRKRKGKEVHVEAEPEREEPTDLLEALRASVEAHGRRGRESRRRNGSLGELTKAELEKRARKAGIEGRSSMTKDELVDALEAR